MIKDQKRKKDKMEEIKDEKKDEKIVETRERRGEKDSCFLYKNR